MTTEAYPHLIHYFFDPKHLTAVPIFGEDPLTYRQFYWTTRKTATIKTIPRGSRKVVVSYRESLYLALHYLLRFRFRLGTVLSKDVIAQVRDLLEGVDEEHLAQVSFLYLASGRIFIFSGDAVMHPRLREGEAQVKFSDLHNWLSTSYGVGEGEAAHSDHS